MIGHIWNTDGFGDKEKHWAVSEMVKENKLDFVALIETGRSSFGQSFLNFLAAGLDYIWYCIPPLGRSGGMLVGFNSNLFVIEQVVSGDFSVKFHLRSKSDGFRWILVVVYGAAQESKKPDFLAELVRICEGETLPMLVGGDFNIIRRQEEKNNSNFNARWPFIFNTIIESLELKELCLSGRQYTWASRREITTYEKLDRFLASVEWEQKFPLVTVHALMRTGSDHTPLLINSGDQAHKGNKNHFSFELSWMRHEGFYEMVAKEWGSVVHGNSPTDIWQNKVRHLRQFLKGWAKNMTSEYRKLKEKLLALIVS